MIKYMLVPVNNRQEPPSLATVKVANVISYFVLIGVGSIYVIARKCQLQFVQHCHCMTIDYNYFL